MAKFMAILSALTPKSKNPKNHVAVRITNNLSMRILIVNESSDSRYSESSYLDARKMIETKMKCGSLLFIWNMDTLIKQLTLPKKTGGVVDITINRNGSANVTMPHQATG